jgi:hypothetical protein
LQRSSQGHDNILRILEHVTKYESDHRETKKRFLSEEFHRRNDNYSSVLEWLAPSANTVIEHEMLCRERQGFPESGEWLLRNDKVTNWIDGDPPLCSTLWLHGIPGAGMFSFLEFVLD